MESQDGHAPKLYTIPIVDFPPNFQTIQEIQTSAAKKSSYQHTDQEEYHLPPDDLLDLKPFAETLANEPGMPTLVPVDPKEAEDEPVILR